MIEEKNMSEQRKIIHDDNKDVYKRQRECGWEVFWNLTAKEAGRI